MAAQALPIRRPKSELRALGEWEGATYGELGVLAAEPDGGRIQCHACGKWFRFLAAHVWQRHRLTADEYRAIFGLKTTTGLMNPNMKDRRREITGRFCVSTPGRESPFSARCPMRNGARSIEAGVGD